MMLRDAVVAAIEDLENAPDCELGQDIVTAVIALLRNALVEDAHTCAAVKASGDDPAESNVNDLLLSQVEHRLFMLQVDLREDLQAVVSKANSAYQALAARVAVLEKSQKARGS